MNEKPVGANSGSHVIVPLTGVAAITAVGALTVWLSANFASYWYADAKSEAIGIGDTQRRRREITFSVAAVESYLLEWVRDEVLKRDFVRLDTYFPPGERRPVTEKWKDTTRALASDRLIPSAPNFTGKTWQNFCRLVEFRNGLVHARASRPQTAGLSGIQMPVPSMEELQALEPGWAVGVITALIRELHVATGTKEPDWLGSSEGHSVTGSTET
jgi:hypothetical protein